MTVTVNRINYQSQLRSKPVDDNFVNIASAVNNLQDQLDTSLTPPAGSEVTNARDYASVLRDRLRGASKITGNALISGGAVTQQASPNMTVIIEAGSAIVDGIYCEWTQANSPTITAPISDTRLDYIVINSDNTKSVITGTPSATPVFPSVASTQIIIGALVVKSTTITLNDNVEVFNFINYSSILPNIYINATYTATNKLHNNVVIDMSGSINEIIGAIHSEGNCYVVNYDSSATVVSNVSALQVLRSITYNIPTDYTKYSGDTYGGVTTIQGTGGNGNTSGNALSTKYGTAIDSSKFLGIKGYNVIIKSLKNKGSKGLSGVGYYNGSHLKIGESGGNATTNINFYIYAISNINVLSGGLLDISGSDGGDGASVSVSHLGGNLSGDGGSGGAGGRITMYGERITNNGAYVNDGGSGGAGGVSTNATDKNVNGTNGASGSAGSALSSNEYETLGYYYEPALSWRTFL